ncbi:MAG: VWA domain-containing protein, partial [bacterium]|nr:VWA domain-containing protein [bacterium]
SHLTVPQDFHVIFFAKGDPKELPDRRLVPASDRYKIKAAGFLDEIRPHNRTDPVPALKRAFNVLAGANPKYKGKMLYLLTDGEFPDNRAVLAEVKKLNTSGDVHVFTFLYEHRGKQAVETMAKIAAENGGEFKQVSVDE